MVAQAKDQNKRDFRVVGVDQALLNTGLCCNVNGDYTTVLIQEKRRRGAERLASIYRQVMLYLSGFNPELIAMEDYSYGSVNRPFDLGEVGGVLKLLFHDRKVPYILVPPKMLKAFVAADGDADKDKMIRMVRERYGVRTENDNIADAVGLARFAEVFLTECSPYRCELDAILRLKECMASPKKRKQFKRVTTV